MCGRTNVVWPCRQFGKGSGYARLTPVVHLISYYPNCRSVASWFTEEGELVAPKFFKEIKTMYLNVSQSKKE